MKDATANAAQASAPSAPAPKQQPAWMTMPESSFVAYLKTAKIGGKRAEEMRQRRAGAESVIATAGDAGVEAVKPPAGTVPLGQLLDEDDDIRAATAAAEVMAQGLAKAAKSRRVTAAHIFQEVSDKTATQAGALRTRFIDPGLIDVQEGWNARVDFGEINELKDSIRAQKKLDGHGLINDIRVKEKADGRYALVDGERRLISVLGLIDDGEVFEFGIPAKVEPAEATDRQLLIKMFTANQGKPFLPYEEAIYYKRLRDDGMTIAQIEAQTGRSDNSIVGALALLQADDDLVEAVVKGQISGGMAKSIAVNVRGNKARQKELVAKAAAATKKSKAGDHKALRAVKKEVDDERRAKAARTSKKLGEKMAARMMDKDDVSALGQTVAVRLKELMEKIGLAFDTDMHDWTGNDRELQIAANFGALEALKAIMGDKTAKVEF